MNSLDRFALCHHQSVFNIICSHSVEGLKEAADATFSHLVQMLQHEHGGSLPLCCVNRLYLLSDLILRCLDLNVERVSMLLSKALP